MSSVPLGLDQEGRDVIRHMIEEKRSGGEIRDTIKSISVDRDRFDREANNALVKELLDKGYTQTAEFLRQRNNGE